MEAIKDIIVACLILGLVAGLISFAVLYYLCAHSTKDPNNPGFPNGDEDSDE
jgi:hypothetical protein